MYKDRGIIKWAPFDALSGFHEEISKMLYQKHKKDKPILSVDQLEEMNKTIMFAISNNKEVFICYYEDGYIKTVYEGIKKVDLIERSVKLSSNFKLNLDSIVKIDC